MAFFSLRMKNIKLTQHLECSPKRAWQMWTNSEDLRHFFGESNRIELKVGGAYEIYFSTEAPLGQQGSENCTIISFEKDKSLQFTWNAPPSIPEARNSGKFTKVTINISPIDAHSCHVELEHSGWEFEGPHWQKTNTYFTNAWPFVLKQLEKAVNKKN